MNANISQLIKSSGELEGLRREVMLQMSVLMENQTRTNVFTSTISDLIVRVHKVILSTLGAELSSSVPKVDAIMHAMDECLKIDRSLNFLITERQRQWQKNGEYLKDILKEFNQTINYLSTTLVDRDLFERQSHVLEQIVLSHERVTNWKEFVQEILLGFHAIFPFNIFFIAFAEETGVGLYIYYFGEYNDTLKSAVREKLSHDLLEQLQVQGELPLDIEEYQVSEVGAPILLEEVHLITVSVPEHTPKLAGLLGLAYASVVKLNAQERSIIRSLLSVMVMVVGSSKQLSSSLEELDYFSNHDPLTNLLNRRRFNELLEYEVGRAERHHHKFCLLMLDLDNFKDINDSYGHPTGDTSLVLIAEALRTSLGNGDIAARIGGDEFAVILPEAYLNQGQTVAKSLLDKLQQTHFTAPDGKSYRVTTSIGLVCYPKDGNNVKDLMAAVDVALYHAKGLGKNEVSTLENAKLHASVTRSSKIHAEELREDMSAGLMVPYFQPIIHCKTGEVFANEALARIEKTDGTIVNAYNFIETIDKHGLARDLDKVIVTKALTASRDHMLATGRPARVFLNIAPIEIQGRGILSFAEERCSELGLPPSSVVFELLERDAIGDMGHMARFLSSLRDKGFAFALDDFGSGYNSFHYLRELHFEYVKIDGAFVHNIINSPVDRALVRNLGHLCQDLGILTVAEFVESEETLHMLQDMGIDFAQGYAIGLPASKLSFAPYVGSDPEKRMKH